MSVIGHGQARRIAAQWHSGQSSALCALATSGHLDRERVEHEILDSLSTVESDGQEHRELSALLKYARIRGDGYPLNLAWASRWDETTVTPDDVALDELFARVGELCVLEVCGARSVSWCWCTVDAEYRITWPTEGTTMLISIRPAGAIEWCETPMADRWDNDVQTLTGAQAVVRKFLAIDESAGLDET